MNIDERQRLWFFSRGERIAVIVLLIAIAATLLARRYIQKSPDIEICDTTWLEEEIPVFEEQLSRPQKTRKKAKHTHQDSKNYNLSNKKEQQNNKQQNNPVKFSFLNTDFR